MFDTLVVCLPHGAWKAFAAEHPMVAKNTEFIVDLSSDHRAGEAGYVYGLPEAFRDSIRGATRIANPGCYPTAATLALLPALEQGWLGGPVTITALSGVSGAGRKPALRTSFVELDGGAAFYKVGEEHQHVPEMARNLGRLAGHDVAVAFAPQLAPMARGMCEADVTSSQRSPGFGSTSLRVNTAFSSVLRDWSSSTRRSSGRPRPSGRS